MATIRTYDDLSDYIFRQLGAPSVEVELTDDQIRDCIEYSIKEYSSFAWDGELKEVAILKINGKGTYQLPDFVTNLIEVKSVQKCLKAT